MSLRAVRFFTALVLVSLAACAPQHTVKPLPDFVRAGVAAGDEITVTLHDGSVHEFEFQELRGDLIIGDGLQLALADIASIKKRAWSRPQSPCGDGKPLGCSVPALIALTSESHGHYVDFFYDACAQHDYCYRHGHASYGIDRATCDDEFLADMQNLCPAAATGTVGKIVDFIDDSVESRYTCLSVADDYYFAVREYAADRFETTNSTYCEYNGPPPAARATPRPAAGTKPR